MHYNSRQYRTINRRGLFNPDGDLLPHHTIRAAIHGSIVDLDVCHLAVRDMVSNMCNNQIARIVREFDLENNVWFTRPYDECGRYADDIIQDWRAYGTGTYYSIYDVASAYVHEIRNCPKPNRVFDSSDDFTFTIQRGRIPKSLHEPASPIQYTIGDGHSNTPDGVGHPLLAHMESCVPSGLTPHGKSGCSMKFSAGKTFPTPSPRHVESITQVAKEKDIARMIHECTPDAAYILERNERHDVLLYGDIDASLVYSHAESIQALRRTPLNCMVMHDDTLLYEECGNDAKRIIHNGKCVLGSLNISGHITPPRPAAISQDELIVNLDRYGFPLCVLNIPQTTVRIRPEYVIAASFFTDESRLYLSGTAVLLCKSNIDWGLMLYLAKVYGFARTLYGILRGLAEEGHILKYPLSALRGCSAVKIKSDLRETLRVYDLASVGELTS